MTGKTGKDVYIRVPCGVVVSKKPIDDPYAVHYPRGGVDDDVWGDEEEEEDSTSAELDSSPSASVDTCSISPPTEEEMLAEQIADLSGEVDEEVIQVLKKHNNNPFNKFIRDRSESGGSGGGGTAGSGGGGGIMWEKAPGEDRYEGVDGEEGGMEEEPEEVGFELEYDKQTILVARGGDAGLGNYTAKGSKNRKPTLVSRSQLFHGMEWSVIVLVSCSSGGWMYCWFFICVRIYIIYITYFSYPIYTPYTPPPTHTLCIARTGGEGFVWRGALLDIRIEADCRYRISGVPKCM